MANSSGFLLGSENKYKPIGPVNSHAGKSCQRGVLGNIDKVKPRCPLTGGKKCKLKGFPGSEKQFQIRGHFSNQNK